jgi:SPX domain protein involved in polyphosphate accumulation
MEYEVKYVFWPSNRDYIKKQLDVLCKQDAEFAGNVVHSLYFDTLGWDFAMDKASSDYLKTKIRVRWYTSFDGTKGRSVRVLEVKNKIGSKRKKLRMELGDEFSELDHSGPTVAQTMRLNRLLQEVSPEQLKFNLVPALYVTYRRHRFYEPFSDSRISLDTSIKCKGLANVYSNLSGRQFNLDKSVLEVKGAERNMPTILQNPLAGYVKKDAFSKYYESFQLIKSYNQ